MCQTCACVEAQKGHCVKLWGWSQDFTPDSKITKKTESWPTYQGELLTGGEPARRTEVCCSQQSWKIGSSEEHFDMEMWGLKLDLLVVHLALAKYFLDLLYFLPFRMEMHILCHIRLEVWELLFNFIFTGVTVKRLPWVSKETELRPFKWGETVIDHGDILNWPECLFALWYGYKPKGATRYKVVVWIKILTIN